MKVTLNILSLQVPDINSVFWFSHFSKTIFKIIRMITTWMVYTTFDFCQQIRPKSINITLLMLIQMATVGMFDWRLFDNSNRTKVVWWPIKLGCWQLSNIKLIELNQESDYVRLMLCSTNVMFNNVEKLYIFGWT